MNRMLLSLFWSGLLCWGSGCFHDAFGQSASQFDSLQRVLRSPLPPDQRLKLTEQWIRSGIREGQGARLLPVVDSTLAALAKHQQPNSKVLLDWQLLRHLVLIKSNQHAEAVAYGLKLQSLISRGGSHKRSLAVLRSQLVVPYYRLGQLDSARALAAEARRMFAQLNMAEEWADVRMKEGVFLAEQGEFKDALRAMLDSDSIFARFNKPELRGQLLLNISQLQHLTGDRSSSELNLQKAYEILDSCRCSDEMLMIVLQNRAANAADSANFAQALDLYTRALPLARKTQRDDIRVGIHTSLAKIYTGLKQYEPAQIHLDEVLELARQIDQPSIYHDALLSQASLDLLRGRPDAALAKLSSAQSWFEQQNHVPKLMELFTLASSG